MTAKRNPTQIETFWRFCQKYYDDYGGTRAVLASPFFIVSAIFAFLSYDSWDDGRWTDMVFQAIPNLLGFSLGTYALLFSLMSNPIKNALKKLRNKRGKIYIDELNATFLHFIAMQVLAFVWAYAFRLHVMADFLNLVRPNSFCTENIISFFRKLGSIFGITIFIYSFLLTFAASLAVYRIARISEPE